MSGREKTIAKRLSTISEKWGNYRTETSKGMRELCTDFEWLLTTCEQLVSELDREREENRKLRQERDTIYADWNKEKDKQIQLTYELLTAQQEIERLHNLARQERETADHWMSKHHNDVVKLREEREKLIEGLRYFMKEFGKVSVSPATAGAGHAYKKMLAILKEIGVMVE